MKKVITGVALGLIIGGGTFALAKPILKTIEVSFNAINLEVDGKKVSEETILYDGTTYVPLRATADMLGLYTNWDETTNTAKITKVKPTETKPVETAGKIESFVDVANLYLKEYPGSYFLQIEMSLNDNDVEIFKVEGFDKTHERDIKFDKNGNIIERDIDSLDSDDYDEFFDDDDDDIPFTVDELSGLISYTKAIEIAKQKTSSRLDDIKLEKDSSKGFVYEADFDDDRDQDYDVKINAKTGEIIEIYY